MHPPSTPNISPDDLAALLDAPTLSGITDPRLAQLLAAEPALSALIHAMRHDRDALARPVPAPYSPAAQRLDSAISAAITAPALPAPSAHADASAAALLAADLAAARALEALTAAEAAVTANPPVSQLQPRGLSPVARLSRALTGLDHPRPSWARHARTGMAAAVALLAASGVLWIAQRTGRSLLGPATTQPRLAATTAPAAGPTTPTGPRSPIDLETPTDSRLTATAPAAPALDPLVAPPAPDSSAALAFVPDQPEAPTPPDLLPTYVQLALQGRLALRVVAPVGIPADELFTRLDALADRPRSPATTSATLWERAPDPSPALAALATLDASRAARAIPPAPLLTTAEPITPDPALPSPLILPPSPAPLLDNRVYLAWVVATPAAIDRLIRSLRSGNVRVLAETLDAPAQPPAATPTAAATTPPTTPTTPRATVPVVVELRPSASAPYTPTTPASHP